MNPWEVYKQQNGDITKAYYAEMNAKGYAGMLAVALFRAQKRSDAAKRYRNHFSGDAYDVKNWSLEQVVAILTRHDFGFEWGWKEDPHTPGFTWVLYVDLPTGQCSFHTRHPICAARKCEIKRYTGRWNPGEGSLTAILLYCDSVQNQPAPARAERETTDVN
jgi:hypothetical protein